MSANFSIPADRFFQPQRTIAAQVDPVELFLNALREPHRYPPIDQIAFAGDVVSFVLMADLGDAEQVAVPLIGALPELLSDIEIHFVSKNGLAITESQISDWRANFAEANLKLNFVTHDASDSEALAQIAINRDGHPLHINRTIFESDVVIPVGSLNGQQATAGQLYPDFASQETHAQFFDQAMTPVRQQAEIRLVEESIGINFLVLVDLHPGGGLANVQCGEKQSMHDLLADPNSMGDWDVPQQEYGRVVVATIESKSQSWPQILNAIVNAARASFDNDRIVICCELDTLPTENERDILQLQFETDREKFAAAIHQIPSQFRNVPEILEEKSVFLRSNLQRSDVEELGLGFIENDEQLQRIIDAAETGVFLRDAHLCRITASQKI